MAFVKTDTVLDKILAHKVEEVASAKARCTVATLEQQAAMIGGVPDFAAALRCDTVALIAEVKKASPSKGVLIEDFDPVEIAQIYAQNGAAAISVLTDERFFQGHLDYLKAIRSAVSVPLLRKEFVIDAYQVYEARAYGASAVLLIVAALDDAQLRDLHAAIIAQGMTPLVEVHHETELERALAIGASVIGINSRDLKTFNVDMDVIRRVAALVPDEVTLIAESGITSAQDVYRMGQLGAHAVLVGESLVKSGDMAASVRDYSAQLRHKANA